MTDYKDPDAALMHLRSLNPLVLTPADIVDLHLAYDPPIEYWRELDALTRDVSFDGKTLTEIQDELVAQREKMDALIPVMKRINANQMMVLAIHLLACLRNPAPISDSFLVAAKEQLGSALGALQNDQRHAAVFKESAVEILTRTSSTLREQNNVLHERVVGVTDYIHALTFNL